jgi:hypothetical protein
MTGVKITTPSRGRWDRVSTTRFFPDTTLIVREDEADRYREHNPTVEIVTIPPHIDNLPKKRQWIWDQYGDVFMVDDDITSIINLSAAPGEPTAVEDPVALVNRTYELAKDLGVSVFSYTCIGSLLHYSPFDPLSLTGSYSAHAGGLIKDDKLKFNPNVISQDDGWVTLMNAYLNRMCLVDNRYRFYHKDTMANPGGLSSYRNREVLKREIAIVREAFGDCVVDHSARYESRESEFLWDSRLPF